MWLGEMTSRKHKNLILHKPGELKIAGIFPVSMPLDDILPICWNLLIK
jgi:hypothetical protein